MGQFLYLPHSTRNSQSIIIWGPVSKAPIPTLQHKKGQMTRAHVQQDKGPEFRKYNSFIKAAWMSNHCRGGRQYISQAVHDANII